MDLISQSLKGKGGGGVGRTGSLISSFLQGVNGQLRQDRCPSWSGRGKLKYHKIQSDWPCKHAYAHYSPRCYNRCLKCFPESHCIDNYLWSLYYIPGIPLITSNTRSISFIISFTPQKHPVRWAQFLSTILHTGNLRHGFMCLVKITELHVARQFPNSVLCTRRPLLLTTKLEFTTVLWGFWQNPQQGVCKAKEGPWGPPFAGLPAQKAWLGVMLSPSVLWL